MEGRTALLGDKYQSSTQTVSGLGALVVVPISESPLAKPHSEYLKLLPRMGRRSLSKLIKINSMIGLRLTLEGYSLLPLDSAPIRQSRLEPAIFIK